MQAEQDHARFAASRKSCDLAEVEVKGQNDALLGDRLGEHVEIGGTLEALVAEMLCVVALAAQPVDYAEADAHVREELHEALTGMDFLLGQPGGVFDGLLDVFTFEIGIVGKDLFERRAVRDLPDDDRDGDPHSADGGPASEDLRVKRDPVERSRL